MKRPFWLLFGLIVVGAILASAFVLFTPKIGTATRAQIDAALPASLKVQDPPDPAAELRYERLVALVSSVDDRDVSAAQGSGAKPGDPAVLARVAAKVRASEGLVAALLREGGLRYPLRTITTRFEEPTKLKAYAKALALAAKDAAGRGDHAASARLTALSLRYGDALLQGGGVIIDSLVAIAVDAIAVRAAYQVDTAGGFDAQGRGAILALLPVQKGALPELGAAVRRDYQQMFLPVIVDPKRYLTRETIEGTRDERSNDAPAGTFNPSETARLSGAIYDAGIAEASRTAHQAVGKAARLAEAAGAGLPEQNPESNSLSAFWYRLRMNVGKNTLGRQFASQAIVFDGLSMTGQRRAANRNLLRAVLLLRMGRPADLPDPYGPGKLRVDAKRRIVWSVGENGKDDGGDIGAKLGDRSPDLGYRY